MLSPNLYREFCVRIPQCDFMDMPYPQYAGDPVAEMCKYHFFQDRGLVLKPQNKGFGLDGHFEDYVIGEVIHWYDAKMQSYMYQQKVPLCYPQTY